MTEQAAIKLAEAARLIAAVQRDNPELGGILVHSDVNGRIAIDNLRQESIEGLPPGDIVYSPKGLTESYPYKASVNREDVEFYVYLHKDNCWPAYVSFNA